MGRVALGDGHSDYHRVPSPGMSLRPVAIPILK